VRAGYRRGAFVQDDGNCLRAASYFELAEDSLDMCRHCLGADHELLRGRHVSVEPQVS